MRTLIDTETKMRQFLLNLSETNKLMSVGRGAQLVTAEMQTLVHKMHLLHQQMKTMVISWRGMDDAVWLTHDGISLTLFVGARLSRCNLTETNCHFLSERLCL